MTRRGIRFRRLKPSSYGRELNDLVRKQEPQRAVDRLLVAGLIEARSCERFHVLAEHVQDPELAEFYRSLFESEARHHTTYTAAGQGFCAGSRSDGPPRRTGRRGGGDHYTRRGRCRGCTAKSLSTRKHGSGEEVCNLNSEYPRFAMLVMGFCVFQRFSKKTLCFLCSLLLFLWLHHPGPRMSIWPGGQPGPAG